ncbi:GNAT family N-acetyltransferase [Vibrio sp. 404]|uniref:GNAT family N-acetyltransferase n=1 Tax=Vibrio marinisediminis TaxID=2758441 RepID=A0A7W2IU84_9VIBR|nr:GNAT family N-acetyltransferase [Vibrio marinisediminis]MBA5762968.1 GNAT family N-acetyltransferase [Vibrio marinisediminis]
MSNLFTTRPAVEADYEFLFELKKAAEKGPIEQVFGWNEAIQKQIHQQEWDEGRPTILLVENQPIGSYLIQVRSKDLHFARFFILPEFQGNGIGSAILQQVITQSESLALPVTLSYLQGNRVGELYQRHGFIITSETKQFVYMQRNVASCE